jgi:hypothetical protein
VRIYKKYAGLDMAADMAKAPIVIDIAERAQARPTCPKSIIDYQVPNEARAI